MTIPIFQKKVLPLFIIVLSLSCKENKQKTETTSEESTTIASSNLTEVKVYDDLTQAFINCKSNATERSHCRNEITKIISETYDLSEFKNSEGNYVIYDSIQPIVKRTEKWEDIGLATEQKNLNKALEHTNNGGLSLIIDTANTYGHVVMLVPGKSQISGSWGLELPNVLSLLNSKAEKSFNNKSLSFAFKKSDNLHVFLKKQQ